MGPQKLAIYGAGGLGGELAWMMEDINALNQEWEVIGYFDDAMKKGSMINELSVLGGIADLNAVGEPLCVAIAIADPDTKKKVVTMVDNPNIKFPVLMHPSCIAGNRKFNQFGKGTILTAGVILTTQISLGDFVLINLATTIGHHTRIGNFSTVMPGCSISGNVSIGESCLIGTGARTLQNIALGAKSVVGAGAVVTKTFEGKVKLVGVPAINTL